MPNIELNIKKYDKYFITPDYNSNNSRSYFKKIEKILEYGVKLLQFRSKNLSNNQYSYISKKIYDICVKYDSHFIINDFNNFKNNKYCNGIHLTSDNLSHYNSFNIPSDYIVVGSCHNEKEIDICSKNSFNFIVVSPIFDTGNKKGFGWEKFQYFANKSSVPVFALGGMNYKRDINLVKEHGGHGIASVSYFHSLFNV